VGGAFIGPLIDNQAGVNIASNCFKVVKTQFRPRAYHLDKTDFN